MLNFSDGASFHPLKAIPYLASHPAMVEIDSRNSLRPASVLIPIICVDNTWALLFTRRSESLRKHRGQVAFPGGGADVNDADPCQTALRESNEEIGLNSDNVQILGYLPSVPTVSHYWVTPVVGWIQKPFKIVMSKDEVARVFTVPIEWLADPKNVSYKKLETPWGTKQSVVFFNKYDEELVWGFTGSLTLKLLEILTLRPIG